MRYGGNFNEYFGANLLENMAGKKYENCLRINRVTSMSLVSPFWNTVYYKYKA